MDLRDDGWARWRRSDQPGTRGTRGRVGAGFAAGELGANSAIVTARQTFPFARAGLRSTPRVYEERPANLAGPPGAMSGPCLATPRLGPRGQRRQIDAHASR